MPRGSGFGIDEMGDLSLVSGLLWRGKSPCRPRRVVQLPRLRFLLDRARSPECDR
ncbi:hypothetical protein M1O53_01865 [Dehalococcoidia bacterium]|nr:hypothetical protein [Dehalococcoidia bacterium]